MCRIIYAVVCQTVFVITLIVYKVLVGEPGSNSHFGRPRSRQEDSMKINVK
jgi:hypothetical protein